MREKDDVSDAAERRQPAQPVATDARGAKKERNAHAVADEVAVPGFTETRIARISEHADRQQEQIEQSDRDTRVVPGIGRPTVVRRLPQSTEKTHAQHQRQSHRQLDFQLVAQKGQ